MALVRGLQKPPGPQRLTLPALLLVLLAGGSLGRPCPQERLNLRSEDRGPADKVAVIFLNNAGVDVRISWVAFNGVERETAVVGPGDVHSEDSFPGHIFSARARSSSRFLLAHKVQAAARDQHVAIEGCDEMEADLLEDGKGRWPEFEYLARRATSPCVGPSSNWSCVRHVSPEELAARDASRYGFHAAEVKGTPYTVGQTTDNIHAEQGMYMPNVTAYEGGFLKMEMPNRLKELLLPFYAERRGSLKKHMAVPGHFTNDNVVRMDILNLDGFPEVRQAVVQEMRQVLQWWTQTLLKHSMTFGIRVYREGSMLINHVDKKESHIASAVLQVAQDLPEGGGWPLEVIHPHQPGVKEVYLQPGEMVLYEGARLFHGRPMRFCGMEFANVFTHFAPIDWERSAKDKPNPHFAAKPQASLEL